MACKMPIFKNEETACRWCNLVFQKRSGGAGFIALNVEGAHRGRGSGRIRYFPDNSGGYVKNWTDNREALFFYNYREGENISREEKRRRMEQLDRMKEEDRKERLRIQANVKDMASQILELARPAFLHPYLSRKHVERFEGAPNLIIDGVTAQKVVNAYPAMQDGYRQKLDRFGDRLLIVPMTLDTPAPVSLQLINANGKKTFLKGGRVKGTVWRPTDFPVASDEVNCVGLCEGVATALSIRHMYGLPCLAGISAGNLIEAAKTIRTCYPCAEIHVFADRDASGVGEEGASAAVCAVARAKIHLCPEFTEKELARFKALTGGDNPTDFNDLMISREG